MAWQGLHLTQPARLSISDNQIAVTLEKDALRRPIEDLAWIIIDNPQVTITSALLSALSDAGVVVLVSDRRHMPNGMLLPFHTHFRQAGVSAKQVSISLPVQKKLWKAVVQQKIINQSIALRVSDTEGARTLKEMARHVGSGDPDNVEARAARFYWSRLFADFTRENGNDKRNAALNYGYAVLRGTIARAITAVGLLPSLGINHASVTNGFNLADDLMEPFRPFVDRMIKDQLEADYSQPLSIQDRRILAGIALIDTQIGKETMSLLAATEKVASSFVSAIEASDVTLLLLPTLVVS